MHRKLLLLGFAAVLITVMISSSVNNATSNATGAPTGNTGSPFDNKTCAQAGCHGGTATDIFDVITSTVPVTGYEPGATYTITATISDPNLVKFGFQISPQSVTGTLLGTMALTDLAKTKFTSSANKYITHTLAGTSFPGHTATWSFNWTAPAAGTGDVTFYGAFNFTNNNGTQTGDIIKKTSYTIPEGFGVGVADIDGAPALNIFPNPTAGQINIAYHLNHQQKVMITLYDLSGKQVATLSDGNQSAGSYNPSFSLSNLHSGVYFVRVQAGSESFTQKVVKL